MEKDDLTWRTNISPGIYKNCREKQAYWSYNLCKDCKSRFICWTASDKEINGKDRMQEV